MSYLDSPRLHFRGWFQADVSTINNDVRFFQNASFVPEYQQLNQNDKGLIQNNWNPEGTGVFRFLDCAVTSLDGITVQNATARTRSREQSSSSASTERPASSTGRGTSRAPAMRSASHAGR